MDTSNTPTAGNTKTTEDYLEQGLRLTFAHRERPFELCVVPGEYLGLIYNGVVRKERFFAGREPMYVWTNVELEWEEHHYIEVRYWPSSGKVLATVNSDELAQWQL